MTENQGAWAVEASGLGRRYGRRWALAEVSLSVRRAARLLVTGRNGSGKSTLLRVLATAARADRGSARVAGYDIRAGASPHPRASLRGAPRFIADQIARYADVGVSHIVLEAPLRDLDEHLGLMHRFTEDIRPLTE